jgi:hypothetical protein
MGYGGLNVNPQVEQGTSLEDALRNVPEGFTPELNINANNRVVGGKISATKPTEPKNQTVSNVLAERLKALDPNSPTYDTDFKSIVAMGQTPATNVNVNTGTGVSQMEKSTKGTIEKEVQDLSGLYNQLNAIEPLLVKNKDNIGPNISKYMSAKSKYGNTPLVGQFLQGAPPSEYLQLQAELKNTSDLIARLRSGAALNDAEVELYKSMIAPTDQTYETAYTNLNAFKNYIKRKLESDMTTLKQGGFDTGTNPVQTTQKSDPLGLR